MSFACPVHGIQPDDELENHLTCGPLKPTNAEPIRLQEAAAP